jgi:ParB-like chromosome segregation protein Spo0J
MAKRRRLDPAPAAGLRAPEVKAMGSPFAADAPIARVAGDAAQAAALAEVAGALASARAEGRLIEALPLGAIVADHLIRDRVTAEDADLPALIESLRARGQQVPVEVEPLGGGRYGLISGWRRLTALSRLQAETGAAEFATIRAILRAPRDAAEAYVAMVEENEIRLGLSHYERARIVARSVAGGVFADTQTALRRLFAQGSRARRSKIGAFLTVVAALDGHLRYPAALGERLGLTLAARLEGDAALAGRLRAALAAAAPADAAAEAALIAGVLGGGRSARAKPLVEEAAPGVRLQTAGGWLHPVLTLSGPGVDQAFRDRLVDWLRKSAAS